MLLQNLFGINGACTDVQASHAIGTNTSHTITVAGFCSNNSCYLDGHFFSLDTMSEKCGLSRLVSQSISDELRLREVCSVSGCRWLMAFDLHLQMHWTAFASTGFLNLCHQGGNKDVCCTVILHKKEQYKESPNIAMTLQCLRWHSCMCVFILYIYNIWAYQHCLAICFSGVWW